MLDKPYVAPTFFIYFILFASSFAFDLIEGDPSIYFSFAKSFFDDPFSFGRKGEISFGATSPITLFIYAIVHEVSASLDASLILLKLVWILLFSIGVNFIVKTAINLSTTTLSYSQLTSIVLTIFLVLAHLINQTIFCYETPLVIAYTASVFYVLTLGRYYTAIVLTGFGYLVRPELILFQVVTFIYIVRQLGLNRHTIAGAFYQLCPILIYHAYFWWNTKLFVPTSISSRISRAYNIEYETLIEVLSKLATNVLNYITLLFILIGIYSYFRRNNGNPVVRYLSLQILLLIPFFMIPGMEVRYFDMSCCAMVLMYTLYIADVNQPTTRNSGITRKRWVYPWILFLVFLSNLYLGSFVEDKVLRFSYVSVNFILASVVFCFLIGSYRYRYTALLCYAAISVAHLLVDNPYLYSANLSVRLDYDGAQKINEIVGVDDRIALYEVQMQYHILAPVLSLDGIVGRGEFIPFYTGKQPFEDALAENEIEYFDVSDVAMADPMKNSTVYSYLHRNDPNTGIGDSVKINDLSFTKVAVNDTDNWKSWGSIYRFDRKR